ncbi:MAG TPA: SDR family NAD(P)-dependent oxidoreductase [Gammaproteobacteria bacterium]|jgi:short-subunit dehydrogenase|nr:SDR family NAD(P)-dependent oxidoreductase [Gammaproteobacteria bacterium]
MDNLNGKTIILTGASQGLGERMARALGEAGAQLVLAARSADKLEALARDIAKGGIRVLVVPCDVTKGADRERLLHRARSEFGTIHVLINNAGVEELGPYAEQDPASVERILATNLAAPMLLTRALLPELLAASDGHIVNIASLAGRTGMPFGAAYSGSKGGLAEWSISLAAELRGSGVSVSVICPGFVDETGMFSRKHMRAPRSIGASRPEDVVRALLDILHKPRVEVIVNPKPVRLLMALRALSPEAALAVGRRLGLMDFLKRIASQAGDGRPL